MSTVRNVTLDEAKELVSAGQPVLVDIWATWCGPCKQMAPVLDSIAEQRDDVTIVKVNFDENPGVAELGISGVPTLILYREGQEVARHTGAIPKPRLTKMLDA